MISKKREGREGEREIEGGREQKEEEKIKI